MRAAVAAGLGPGERALWHGRAARLLWRDGADPERAALQLLEAEPEGDAAAVEALRAAAAAATARGAPESATAYLRRALAEPPDAAPRPFVVLELGLALATHRHRDAPALLREAIDGIPDPPTRAAAGLRAARALGLAALYDDVVEICRATLAGAADMPPDTVARLEAELMGMAMTRAATAREVRERVRRDPPSVPLWRVTAAGQDSFVGRPARETVALLRPVLDEKVLATERESLVATVVLMLVLLWNDEADAAAALADGLLAVARPRGWASAVANGSFLRAMAQLHRGQVGDAEADARHAFDFKLTVSPPDSLAWALAPLVDVLRERDDLDGAERALATASADALTPDLLVFPQVGETRARLRLAQGRPREARADARAAAASWAGLGMTGPGLCGWRLCAAEALVALGDKRAAAALAEEQLALAERLGASRALGAALRAVALSGPRATALAQLERGRAARGHAGRARAHARPRRAAGAAAPGARAGRPRRRAAGTQRTVETHLTHAFAKLGVASRDGLAAALWPAQTTAAERTPVPT